MQPDGERIARIEERHADLRREFDVHTGQAEKRNEAIRVLSEEMGRWRVQQSQARHAEQTQYRRLERRIQILTLVILAATLVLPLVLSFVHH